MAREGCLIGRGDTPLEANGDGVAPRDRGVKVGEKVVVEWAGGWGERSSSSVNETMRRGRERTVEEDLLLGFAREVGLKGSTKLFELIPVDTARLPESVSSPLSELQLRSPR